MELDPLAISPIKPSIAPAYELSCSAMKLEAKDSGITGKSGIYHEKIVLITV